MLFFFSCDQRVENGDTLLRLLDDDLLQLFDVSRCLSDHGPPGREVSINALQHHERCLVLSMKSGVRRRSAVEGGREEEGGGGSRGAGAAEC